MKTVVVVGGILIIGFGIASLMAAKSGSKELEGRVSEIEEGTNLARVSYEDPKSGAAKQLDIAVLPEPNAPAKIKAEEEKESDLEVGDEVKVKLKRNLKTGMYETSIAKTHPT